ncbi:MAG: hypothetical protein AABY26_02620 [Nanoarchaeota archaeon]
MACGNATYYSWETQSWGCITSCVPGESAVTCGTFASGKAYYTRYACNAKGNGYEWKEALSACTAGTTCQSGLCK